LGATFQVNMFLCKTVDWAPSKIFSFSNTLQVHKSLPSNSLTYKRKRPLLEEQLDKFLEKYEQTK